MQNQSHKHPQETPNSHSDGSLVRLVQNGEQAAATDLYVRYSDRLLKLAKRNTSKNLATRFDPEDVVQSVFRSFFRRVSHGAYDVPQGEELWRLLLVLSLNKVRALARHHRAQKRNVDVTFRSATEDEDGGAMFVAPDPQPRQILEMVVDDVLRTMPEAQRFIVEQRIQGHSVVEIADQTKRSRRTVERVIKKFRDTIAELTDG